MLIQKAVILHKIYSLPSQTQCLNNPATRMGRVACFVGSITIGAARQLPTKYKLGVASSDE